VHVVDGDRHLPSPDSTRPGGARGQPTGSFCGRRAQGSVLGRTGWNTSAVVVRVPTELVELHEGPTTLVMVGLAVDFLATRAREIQAAWRRVQRAPLHWVLAKILFELTSMVVFARIQRGLRRAGGVRLRLRTMVEITLAGNAPDRRHRRSAARRLGRSRARSRRRGGTGHLPAVGAALDRFLVEADPVR
jgi:hypothetical protein